MARWSIEVLQLFLLRDELTNCGGRWLAKVTNRLLLKQLGYGETAKVILEDLDRVELLLAFRQA